MNSKRKGNAGENEFSAWLNDNGIKAWKDSMSGGGTREKGDIGNNIDCTIEVKTVKKLNLQSVWQKLSINAGKHQNSPLLAIHFDGFPKDKWLVVLDNHDWLALIKKTEEEKVTTENRNLKWRLLDLKQRIQSVLKEF